MPKLFLSYNSSNREIVNQVYTQLRNRLLDCWMDKSNIQVGDELKPEIVSHIKTSDFFIAFLSEKYMISRWCREELRVADRESQEGMLTIILVLLEDREQIESKSKNLIINHLINDVKCFQFDGEVPKNDKSIENLGTEIWSTQDVVFNPIRSYFYDNKFLQEISFRLNVEKLKDEKLKADFLRDWRFSLTSFLSNDSYDDDSRPLKDGSTILFSGRGPIWLYAPLVMPLYNKRNVYVYTKFEEDDSFVCVYSKGAVNTGKVIKRKELDQHQI